MGAFVDKIIVLGLIIGIISFSASVYGISKEEDIDKCGTGYIAGIVGASMSLGVILMLLLVLLIRINNLCPFTTFLPRGPQSLQFSPTQYY